MRILDRERYWAFLKAYIICFTALVGLYVVIDAFSNFDEFTDRATGIELFSVMGRYYLVHMSQFYDRLCGVIGMMAAIFTVTWMQKNNELLALLAAGISTQRVIRPVIVSAVIVSFFSVVNQELIMPPIGEELQKPHADDGSKKVLVTGRLDENDVYLHGTEGDRKTRTILAFSATIPVEVYGTMHNLQAKQATYIPSNDHSSLLRDGWLLRGAKVNPPLEKEELAREGSLVVQLENEQGFSAQFGEVPVAGGETYFLRTGVTFQSLTRKRDWYQFACTTDLLQSLADRSNQSEWEDMKVFLHTRILRPAVSLALLFVTLPLVLSGYGRNMFINLGLSLGTSAVFYATCFICQYLGAHTVITPEMSAWAPLIGFGTFAAARWGAIRT